MTRRGPFTAAHSTVRLSETRKEASGRVPVSCGSSSRGTHTRDHALMAHPCEGAWPWCHLFASPSARCSHSYGCAACSMRLGLALVSTSPSTVAASRQRGPRGGRDRLGRALGYLHARAGEETARERFETAGTSCRDHPGGGGEQAHHTHNGEDASGGCHAAPPAWVGTCGAIRRNYVLGNGGSNGFLPGGKAGEQHMRTQHVDDVGIPARMSGHVPYGPWCEDGAFAGPGLL